MSGDPTPLESLALELLAVPSVTGAEAALAAHVQDWATTRGLVRVVRAGDSLALQPRPFRDRAPRLLLLGHLDTVPPAGENPPRLDAERIHGLGASDMKCADALILRLVEHAVRVQPAFDVAAVLYAREEGPFHESGLPEIAEAARDLFEDVTLAVAMEPTDNHLELGCLGTLHALVSFHGVRAHSARPWQGRNAIHMAAPFLSRLAALPPREVRTGAMLFREVASATMVDYDGARNVVPGRFDLNVNFRFGPDRPGSEAVAWVAEQVRAAVGADALDRGEVTIEITDLCPSGRVCGDNPLFRSLRQAAGAGAQVRAKQAWTDVGRLSEMGIDALNYGPGSGAQAHQAGEWCSRAHLAEAEQRMRAWLFA